MNKALRFFFKPPPASRRWVFLSNPLLPKPHHPLKHSHRFPNIIIQNTEKNNAVPIPDNQQFHPLQQFEIKRVIGRACLQDIRDDHLQSEVFLQEQVK